MVRLSQCGIGFLAVILALFIATSLAQTQFNIAGTARKFSSSDSPNFNQAGTNVDTSATEWASSTLDFNNKPTFVTGSTATSVTDVSFNQWWQTPFTQMTSAFVLPFSITLTQVGSSAIYRYSNSDFRPFGAGIGLFTYEAAGVFDYTSGSGQTLTFGTTIGDMWVYIQNIDYPQSAPKLVGSLRGISSTLRTVPIQLDSQALNTGRVQVRIFYAHRSTSTASPTIQIDLLVRGTGLCNALTASAPTLDVYPFSGAGVPTLNNGPTTPDINTLQITSTTNLGAGTTAYNNRKHRITSGFSTTFSFQIANYPAGGAEGFSFIVQCGTDGLGARGGSGPNLGYNGLNAALVVEFDTHKDDPFDVNANHVRVHTAYSGAISNAAPLTSVLTGSYGTLSTMMNGGVHTARIDYYPNSSPVTAGAGLITVYVDNIFVQAAEVNDASLNSMCNPAGLVYVGFTASTTATVYANTYITNWRWNTVPLSASASAAIGNFFAQTASNAQSPTRQLYIQSRDVCGNDNSVGGGTVVAQLKTAAGSVIGGTNKNDDGNGQYSVWFWYTNADNSTANAPYLHLSLNGQAIQSSPFTIQINPGVAAAATSTYAAVGGVSLLSFQAGVSKQITVTLRDAFGNLLEGGNQQQLHVQFANSPTLMQVVTWFPTPPHTYTFTVTSDVASTTSLLVQLGVADIVGSPLDSVDITAGTINGGNSLIAAPGLGLTTPVAGTSQEVRLFPRDSFGNQIPSNTGLTPLFQLSPAPSTLTGPTWVGPQSGQPCQTSTTCYFQYFYTANNKTSYIVTASINGGTIPGYGPSGPKVNVAAATVAAAQSTVLFPSGSLFLADSQSTFTLQARDQFRNDRDDVNDALNFYVGLLHSSGSLVENRIQCGVSATGNTANSGTTGLRCDYTNSGKYVVTFTGQTSGNYTITATLGPTVSLATRLGGALYWVFVDPAAASAAQTTMSVPSAVTAGIEGSWTITVRDKFGNLRDTATSTDDSGAFDVQIDTNPAQQVTKGTITRVGAVYTLRWTAYIVGSYSFLVKLGVTTITGGTVSNVLCNPGTINHVTSSVSGNGLTGGIESTTTTVQVTSRDYWRNLLGVQPATTIGCTSTPFGAQGFSGSIGCTVTGASTSGGIFTVQYTLPTYSASAHDFRLVIFITANNEQIFNGTCSVVPTGSVNYGVVVGSGLFVNRVGGSIQSNTQQSFTIENRDAGGLCSSAAVVYNAIFTHETGAQQAVQFQGSSTSSVAPCVTANTAYRVTFSLVTAGRYNLSIRAGAIETEQSKQKYGYLVVGAGGIDTSKCTTNGISGNLVAGTTKTYTVGLVDTGGNPFSSNGGFTTSQFSISFPSGAGASGCTAGATNTYVDNGDGTFTLNFRCTLAGAVQVETRLTGQPIRFGGQSYGLTVINAAPAPATTSNSRVANTGGVTYTAGAAGTLAFFVFDSFNNPVNDVKDGTYGELTIALDLHSSLNVSFIKRLQVASFPGEYTLTFTPQRCRNGNPQLFSVYIGGTFIASTLIGIRPAVYDLVQSTVTFDTPSPFQAGVPFFMTLNARDRFGNFWFNESARITASVGSGTVAVSTFNGLQSSFKFRVTVGSTGSTFQVTFTTANVLGGVGSPATGTTGNTLFTVAAGPAAALKTIANVTGILPDNPSPPLPRIAGSWPAGQTRTLGLQLRDSSGNYILTGGDSVTFRVVNTSSNLGLPCNVDEVDFDNERNNQTDHFLSAGSYVIDRGDGTYWVRMRGTRAGLYGLVLFVNGAKTIFSCANIATLFEITPLSAYPPNSLVDGTAFESSIARAGFSLSIRVTMRDIYGNDVTESGQQIRVGVAPTVGPAAACSTNLLMLDFTNPNSTEYFVQTAAGVQQATFVREVAKNYTLIVTVDGELVQTVACYQLSLSAGSPVKFTVVQPDPIYAAIPNRFRMYAQDKFNNTVIRGNHFYRGSFERKPDSAPIGSYTFNEFSLTNPNLLPYLEVEFLAAWAGTYTITLFLNDDDTNTELESSPGRSQLINDVIILPATCAAVNASTPFRCPPPSYLCVETPAMCPGYDMTCAGAGNNLCFNYTTPVGTCAADGVACDCPVGYTKCIGGGGHCVLDAGDCPAAWNEGVCAQGYVKCTTGAGAGECRKSLAECPSAVVCAPGYSICPDKRTCTQKVSDCPVATGNTCSGTTPFLCRDGRCAKNGESCGTAITCPLDAPKLCSDGSCVASPNLCPQQFLCYSPTPVRCPDGSCRAAVTDCPSTIFCPLNYVRCDNGNCAPSLSDCSAAISCPANFTRCPDGSCKVNLLFCGSSITCGPAAPVLCGDRSCVTDATLCLRPPACSDPRPYACPDGTCAPTLALCPTTITCPLEYPVLCPDQSCKASVSQCTQVVPTCPPTLPVKCVTDGSCRARAVDCPTATQCADATPVRCPDGRCVVASDQCIDISLLSCPSGQVRCPAGECAISLNLCPTHISCPASQIRCTDGTCRDKCSNVVPDFLYTCGTGRVVCPQATQGLICANTLDQCPTSLICPPRTPVRCGDQTCAATVEECPVATTYSSARKACPGGFWAAKQEPCGTPVTCPADLPAKCWDETCRVLPSDCPPTPKCPAATPFLCPNGECQDNIYSCSAGLRCTNAALPVKCFAFGSQQTRGCVADRKSCLNVTDTSDTAQLLITNKCPDNGRRCKNGACRADEFQCAELTCPQALPVRCSDGLCAKSASQCNDATTRCPFDAPIKCWNGLCVAAVGECPANPSGSTCSDATKIGRGVACPDGSCAASLAECARVSGCQAGFVKCYDGSCQPETTGLSICLAKDDAANACPQSRPYRCRNGYCALSSYLCPIQPPYVVANITCGYSAGAGVKGVRCADGSCRISGDACPIVKPCPPGTERCGDGTCATRGTATLANACPLVSTCPADRSVRCPNGLCATALDACTNDLTGCPANQQRCDNGLCLPTTDTCPTPALGSGCVDPTPFRCLQGMCVATAADCPAPNGCAATTPFLCSDGTCSASRCTATSFTCATGVRCGDGRCAATASACTLPNQCPVTTPVRCADGSCKLYPAVDPGIVTVPTDQSCQPIVTCPANLPYLCANKECVAESKLCRAVHQCTSGTLCNDMTCRDVCPDLIQRRCPPSAPALCPSGACKKTMVECESQTRLLAASNPCVDPQVLCGDGTCADNWLECGRRTYVGRMTGTWTDTMRHDGNVSCPVSTFGNICHDGTCVPHVSMCPPVPRCPDAFPWRCPDGSCKINGTNGANPCPTMGACEAGTTRCADGYCRLKCFELNGCPLSLPYYCGGKKQPCVASYSVCEATINTLSTSRRLLALATTLDPPEACADGCLKNVPAILQTVNVPFAEEITFDIAVDATGISRTSMTIPSGALAVAQTMNIYPVPTQGLDRTGFAFAQKVLSTPWRCTTERGGQFALNVSVESSIDTRLYNLNTGTTSSGTNTFASPCWIQSDYIASRPVGTDGLRCSGEASISATGFSLGCDEEALSGTIQTVHATYPGFEFDGTSTKLAATCICVNVTGGNTGAALRSLQCMSITRLGDVVMGYMNIDPLAAGVCPDSVSLFSTASMKNYTLARLAGVDACGGKVISAIQEIPPQDICLGTIDPVTSEWRCLAGRQERVDFPTWDSASGRPRSRVVGRISMCQPYSVYAFVNIKLPDAPIDLGPPFDWWAKWGAIVIGVSCAVVFIIAVSSYAISRLIRYRRKYREKKKELDQLTERAQDLDQYAGGLGIADEEVDMVANPLVVEMQELEKQVKAINDDIAKEGDENAQIDELERERQRIFAEIQKIKEQLSKDQAAAQAARVSVDKGPVSLSAGAGVGTSSTPARAPPRQQPARHDFGDAKRPARKKKGEE